MSPLEKAQRCLAIDVLPRKRLSASRHLPSTALTYNVDELTPISLHVIDYHKENWRRCSMPSFDPCHSYADHRSSSLISCPSHPDL